MNLSKQSLQLSRQFYLFFQLLLLLLISTCSSAPTPAPEPVFEPIIEYAGKSLLSFSKAIKPVLSPISEKAGTLYGKLSLYSPYMTEKIMENSVKVAVANPKLTAPLAQEIGKAGALAFVGNKEKGMLIVKATNEGVWEVLSAATKEYFTGLGSRIKYLATSFKDSVFSKIPGMSKIVPAAPLPPAQVVSERVAEVGLAASVDAAAPLQRTWAQYFADMYNQVGQQVTQLQGKVEQLTDNGLQFSLKASAKVATSTPEFIESFGKTSTRYAEEFVKSPEHQARVAREFGRVAAREFLQNPKAASAVIYQVSKGAVPILYKEYITIFSNFIKELGRLAAAFPTKAVVSLKESAEKILIDMKALMAKSKQIEQAAATGTSKTINVNAAERPQDGIHKVQDLASASHQVRKRQVGMAVPLPSFAPMATAEELDRLESLSVENDPFLKEMHATIVQFQKLGHLIYFKTQPAHLNMPLMVTQ